MPMKTTMGLLVRSMFRFGCGMTSKSEFGTLISGEAHCAASLRALTAAGTNLPSNFCIAVQRDGSFNPCQHDAEIVP